MEDSTAVKFVIYTDDQSEPKTVVDTLDEAKKELETLKGQHTKVKIDKATVKNFGKDNEEIVASETAEKWEKETPKDPEPAPAATPDSEKEGDGKTPDEPIEKEVEQSFKEYYENNGALVGFSYFLVEKEKVKETEPKKEDPKEDEDIDDVQDDVDDKISDDDDGKVEVKGVDYEEFIEKCKEPEAKGIADYDAKVTVEFLNDLNKHGVKKLKINQESREIFFVTDTKTNYKELLKTVTALGADDCEELKNNTFRLNWK